MLAACLQMDVKLCDRISNQRRALEMAVAAAKAGAEVIAFPELFLTGFCYDLPPEDLPCPVLDPFRELSEEYGCLILGSLMSGRENLGFCIEGDKTQFRPKIHPFVPERPHFQGGDFLAPVQTSLGKIGLQICYDLRFPEVARSLALQGADLLVTVGEFPAARLSHWRVLSLARAVENQLPHIACNWAEAGGSMVVGAQGDIIAETSSGEAFILGEIDLTARDSFRRQIPCFEDRRPEVYRL